MPNYYVQTTLLAQSGETADSQSNVFAFESTGGLDQASADAFTVLLKNYYDALRTAAALRGIAQNGHTTKYYLATTVAPNYPLFAGTFNLAVAPAAIELPLEMSLCVSYANDTETSVPARRRRGRIYVSGWAEAENTNGRPTSTVLSNMTAAYKDLVDDVNVLSGVTACVWSRTNAALYPIERIWCDNEWDTMRSRGGKSTARVTVAPA